MQFHILEGKINHGPFDLVAMIRKIRNGSLAEHTMVLEIGKSDAVRAADHPTLLPFFQEAASSGGEIGHNPMKDITLRRAMSAGWNFFQNNQLITVYTGLFVLFALSIVVILRQALPEALQIPGMFLAFIIDYFLFCGYLIVILRLNRGQPAEIKYILEKFSSHFKPLMAASCIICLIALLGFVFFIIPGLFILTLYIFTPLLITDRDLDFWDAMETSRKTVLANNLDFIGIVFALVVINFIAGMLFVFPLVLSLPITFSALAEIYDELYNS